MADHCLGELLALEVDHVGHFQQPILVDADLHTHMHRKLLWQGKPQQLQHRHQPGINKASLLLTLVLMSL